MTREHNIVEIAGVRADAYFNARWDAHRAHGARASDGFPCETCGPLPFVQLVPYFSPQFPMPSYLCASCTQPIAAKDNICTRVDDKGKKTRTHFKCCDTPAEHGLVRRSTLDHGVKARKVPERKKKTAPKKKS